MPDDESTLADAVRQRELLVNRGADCGPPLDLGAAEFAAAFAAAPRYAAYQHVPPQCAAVVTRILETEHGHSRLENYLRLATVEQVLRLPRRIAAAPLPTSIVARIWATVKRVLAEVASGRPGFFSLDNDLFLKDFAVCRLKLLPCGVETLDTGAGIARRTLWSYGLRHVLPVARAFAEMGGYRPILEGHWDRRAIREFNADGYRRFYALAAELLAARPEFLGLCGRSWWFDPALRDISPELAFLREESEAHGAVFVPVETDPDMVAHALRMRSRRQQLHAEGRYTPQNTLWIWPRRRVLRWAEKNA